MTNLPLLRSGSTVQYPFVTTLTYATNVIRFVDGSEQRFMLTKDAKRSWKIPLKDLTPAETEALRAFAKQTVGGGNQMFTFHDPVTGEVHGQCRLLAEPVLIEHTDEQRAQLSLTVVEVD